MSGNSHQRRVANRHWRHLAAFEGYIYSKPNMQLRELCNKQFGRKNYGRTWAMWRSNNPTMTVLALHKDKDYAWLNLMI